MADELDGLLARLDENSVELKSDDCWAIHYDDPEGKLWEESAAAIRHLRTDNESLRLAALAVQEMSGKACDAIYRNGCDAGALQIANGAAICARHVRDLHLDPLAEGRKYREQVRREERERCEKICDDENADAHEKHEAARQANSATSMAIRASAGMAATRIRDAIRALADKPEEPTT